MDRRFAVVLAPEGVEIREDVNGLHDSIITAMHKAKKMGNWPLGALFIWPTPWAPAWFKAGTVAP